MWSFRINLSPFLFASHRNDLELNTVSGVSVQARLSLQLLPKYLSSSLSEPRPLARRPSNDTPPRRFHCRNKKDHSINPCDINVAMIAPIAVRASGSLVFPPQDLGASGVRLPTSFTPAAQP